MPYQPPEPLPAPTQMPAVPAHIASLTVAEVDWFTTAAQEASSEQLAFRYRAHPQRLPGRLSAIDLHTPHCSGPLNCLLPVTKRDLLVVRTSLELL